MSVCGKTRKAATQRPQAYGSGGWVNDEDQAFVPSRTLERSHKHPVCMSHPLCPINERSGKEITSLLGSLCFPCVKYSVPVSWSSLLTSLCNNPRLADWWSPPYQLQIAMDLATHALLHVACHYDVCAYRKLANMLTCIKQGTSPFSLTASK